MRLSDFILSHLEPILAEWESFAGSIWPGTAATDPATLRNDAEEILRATVLDMNSAQTAAQQSLKSKGKGVGGAEGLDRASVAHGVGRVASGFDLAALISEYRALRASVLLLWRQSCPEANGNDLEDITRFNESIDQSLTEAALAYTQQVQRERQAALEGQQRRSEELSALNEALLVSSVRQHELMEQATTASRAKDQFLAVLSHELRTPLTPVLMTVAAMDMNPDLAPAVRNEIAMVRRNVELEAKLIDDLLDLSRVTSGKLRLTFEPVDIHSALRNACETCRPFILEKGIQLRCDFPGQGAFVNADPARLQQFLWNLLRNAAKFTPEHGEIFVSVSAVEGDRLQIQVRDTGVGIPQEILPKIFDAFEQGDASITRQFGGMGLGLAISKALVEMHGGTIRAETGGPGRGSTFTVELPVIAAPAASTSGEEPPHNNTPAKLRLLIVEDHLDTARVLNRLLSQSGYVVRIAHSASAALQLAAEETFDVIVSDIGLPDATGYDLMREIKSRHALKGIAMSGYGMDEDLRKSREAGFSDHIVKPANIAQLDRLIRRISGTE